MFWYATAMAAPIQQLMLLNTKGDIMKKKKKLIKVVVILLVTAIVAGTVFIWKSHKAKAAAAAATAEAGKGKCFPSLMDPCPPITPDERGTLRQSILHTLPSEREAADARGLQQE